MSRTIKGHGLCTITIEQDPLETMRMGAYANSCLNVGGSFSYSAAAIVLDINKQVAYAKNSNCTIIGRQLIAIDDNDQFLGYSVYPNNAHADIKHFFKDFCEDWSKILDLQLYKHENDDDDYKIQNVLSNDWWDDTPWQFDIDMPITKTKSGKKD